MVTARARINIAVTGDNRGAIVVGDNNTVVINQTAGAVVLPPEPVHTTRRDEPVRLGPRPLPDVVDRTEESAKLLAALSAVPPAPADVFGSPGIGKTALLRHVCGSAEAQAPFRDGVVYMDAARQGVDDVLQQLFEAFFETDQPFKPNETQLRKFLARTMPLVILDGSPWGADELERLLNLAATATVALSGASQVLLGQGCAIALHGLPSDDSLVLMGRELGHAIEGSDIMSGRTIAAALDGNPLNLLLVSAHARVFGVPIVQLAEGVRAAESPEAWLQALVNSKLSERDRKALAAFATVDCAPLDASEVAAISGDENAPQELESLADRKLVAFDGTRYRVASGIAAGIAMGFLAMLPAEAAAQAFLQTSADPSTLVAHSDAVVGTLKQAALAGKHAEAVALAHHAGDAVALAGRWNSWHTMLQQALSSAQAAHDTIGEAWALHQLGSQALALGDVATAQTALQAAMHLRAELGDPMAVAVTQHNLGMLHLPVAPLPQTASVAHTSARWSAGAKVAAAVFGFVAVVGSVGTWVAAKTGFWTHLHVSPPVVASSPLPHHVSSLPHPVLHHAPPAPHPALPPVARAGSTQLPRPVASQIAETKPPETSQPPQPPNTSRPPMQSGSGSAVANLPVNMGGHRLHFPPRTEPPHTVVTSTPHTTEMPKPPEIVTFSYAVDRQCLVYEVRRAERASVGSLEGPLTLPSGCVPVKQLTKNKTYTLTAYGYGERSQTVTIAGRPPGNEGNGSGETGGIGVRQPPPSIVEFEYQPGEASCLYYKVRNAERATIRGIGTVGLPNGCATVRQQQQAVTYTLVVVGRNGHASTETTVPARAPVYNARGSSYGTSPYVKSPYEAAPSGSSPYDAVPKTPVKPIYAAPAPDRTRAPYRTPLPYRTPSSYRTPAPNRTLPPPPYKRNAPMRIH